MHILVYLRNRAGNMIKIFNSLLHRTVARFFVDLAYSNGDCILSYGTRYVAITFFTENG